MKSNLYYDLQACKSVLDEIRDIIGGYFDMTRYHNAELEERIYAEQTATILPLLTKKVKDAFSKDDKPN